MNFEKPQMMSAEQKEMQKQNELEALSDGSAWLNVEGVGDEEAVEAFKSYLENCSWDELHQLNQELQEMYKWNGLRDAEEKLKEVKQKYEGHISNITVAWWTGILTGLNGPMIAGAVAVNEIIRKFKQNEIPPAQEKVEEMEKIHEHLLALSAMEKDERESKASDQVRKMMQRGRAA